MDINLTKLQEPKYLVKEIDIIEKEHRQEAKDLIQAQKEFTRSVLEKVSRLGLTQEEIWIHSDSQSDWDRFIEWQKANCESILLITPYVFSGSNLKMSILYKPKKQ